MDQETRRVGRPRADEFDIPTEQRIIIEAARLFSEKGFDGVTTEAVAIASGVTKAMVYYYFSSKTNLFTSAVEWMMERGRLSTLKFLEENIPLRNRLEKIAVTRIRIAAPLEVDAMMQGSRTSLNATQLERIQIAETKMLDVLTKAFERAILDGEIRSVEPSLAVRVFLAVLTIGKAEQDDGMLSEDRVESRCRELIDLFWNGVNQPSGFDGQIGYLT